MIRILAKEYSNAVATLCAKLDKEAAQYDVYYTRSSKALSELLVTSVGLTSVMLVGDTGKWCNTFAQTFELAMVYDKFAEKNIREYWQNLRRVCALRSICWTGIVCCRKLSSTVLPCTVFSAVA